MTQFFAKAALAALIGLGSLGATATTASADSIEFGISRDGGFGVEVRDRDRDGWRDRERGNGGWRRHDRGGRCAPWMAEDKARDRFGLRRAQVVDVTPRRVIVEGRRHGRIQTVAFANDRGCPTLGGF
ncbi:hypothetical protein [Pararhizobium sp.]|uniref:hypothetical protein n=1 Tax=Pararhizobium sp. TaxID=1977563 RepID=UPI002719A6DF|nr:hypothetical protein [Pararhizobium sp.]MDO9414698.1 hypothetical protein [Pararhizobium sp.]